MAIEDDLSVRACRMEDTVRIADLWKECGLIVPWNDPVDDIRMKLDFQPDLFLVGEINGVIITTVMAGYEGHRGWINYLAVDPDYRKRGIGRRLMKDAESKLRDLGCPKINLQVRAGNTDVLEFYRCDRPGLEIGDRSVHGENGGICLRGT